MSYIINSSDQNPNKSIIVDPNTFIGSINPFSYTPAIGATDTKLSISLYGKDQPNYGEKIQENLLYLLENFAGITEPTFPVNGQLWFNRASLPNSLKIFNAQKYPITNSTLTTTNLIIEFASTDVVRFNTMLANANNRFKIVNNDPVYNPNTSLPGTYERSKTIEFTVVDSSTPGIIKLTLPLIPAGHYISPALTPSDNNLVGWYIGGWENIVQGNTPGGNLDMQSFNIINLADPVNLTDAVNYQTLQSYVSSSTTTALSGLTDVLLTGIADSDMLLYNAASSKWINIPSSTVSGTIPTSISGLANEDILIYDSSLSVWKNVPPSAHTKIVTATLSFLQPNDLLMYNLTLDEFVNVSVDNHPAGIVTAQITAPIHNDVLTYDGGINTWKNSNLGTIFLPLTGGTMTGDIDLANNNITNVPDPTTPLDVANKQYVDSIAGTGITSGYYDIVTGDLVLNGVSPVNVTADPIVDAVRTRSQEPLRRKVVVSDGVSTTYDFGNIDPTFKFINGFNQLSVYVNGIKSYADTNGYLMVETVSSEDANSTPLYNIIAVDQLTNKFTISGNFTSVFPAGLKIAVRNGPSLNNIYYTVAAPGATLVGVDTEIPVTTSIPDPLAFGSIYLSDQLTLPLPTGLSTSTSYEFRLSVDGGPLNTYTVPGAAAQTIASLLTAINTMIYPTVAVLFDHKILFRSSTPGSTSSINLEDGAVSPLFANMIGSSTSIINIKDTSAFSTSPAESGMSLGYSELGIYGVPTSTIQFNNVLPAGQYIEAIANYVFTT